jgi:hypothetical protein
MAIKQSAPSAPLMMGRAFALDATLVRGRGVCGTFLADRTLAEATMLTVARRGRCRVDHLGLLTSLLRLCQASGAGSSNRHLSPAAGAAPPGAVETNSVASNNAPKAPRRPPPTLPAAPPSVAAMDMMPR